MKELEKRLSFLRIFPGNKKLELPKTEDEVLAWAEYILCDLEPENLSCDGEASSNSVKARIQSLKKEWTELESILNRKITEDEVFKRIINK